MEPAPMLTNSNYFARGNASATRSLPSTGSASQTNMATLLLLGAALSVLVLLAVLVMKLRGRNSGISTITEDVVDLSKSPKLMSPNAALATSDGQDYSFAFWLYVKAIENHDTYPLVFLRSPDLSTQTSAVDPSAVLGTAGPAVFLDKATNKLYIFLRTSKSLKTLSIDDLVKTDSTVVIDYVSLQRWMSVTVAVKDGSVAVYVDGDLYSRYTLPDAPVRPIFSGMLGGFQLGSKSTPRPKALLSKLQVFDRTLTPGQAKDLYRQGPNNASRFGILPYRLRNPLYKLGGDTCPVRR